jgi:uncharacterized protein (TIGR00369 family)
MPTPQRRDQLLEAFRTRASIVQTFGMTLTFQEDGGAVVDLPYNPGFNHARGGVHGGIYMTLIDSAAWFTSAAAHAEGWVATSELTVHLLRPVIETSLRAVGRMIKSGKRLDIVEADLFDGDGNLAGHGIGTFVVLPELNLEASSD